MGRIRTAITADQTANLAPGQTISVEATAVAIDTVTVLAAYLPLPDGWHVDRIPNGWAHVDGGLGLRGAGRLSAGDPIRLIVQLTHTPTAGPDGRVDPASLTHLPPLEPMQVWGDAEALEVTAGPPVEFTIGSPPTVHLRPGPPPQSGGAAVELYAEGGDWPLADVAVTFTDAQRRTSTFRLSHVGPGDEHPLVAGPDLAAGPVDVHLTSARSPGGVPLPLSAHTLCEAAAAPPPPEPEVVAAVPPHDDVRGALKGAASRLLRRVADRPSVSVSTPASAPYVGQEVDLGLHLTNPTGRPVNLKVHPTPDLTVVDARWTVADDGTATRQVPGEVGEETVCVRIDRAGRLKVRITAEN